MEDTARDPTPRGGALAIDPAWQRDAAVAEINVTPMTDVLLVLLVVFMVLQQGMLRSVGLQVPAPAAAQPPARDAGAIVLEVGAGGRLSLDRTPVAAGALERTLGEVYAARPRKVLFVKGAEDARYREVTAAVAPPAPPESR